MFAHLMETSKVVYCSEKIIDKKLDNGILSFTIGKLAASLNKEVKLPSFSELNFILYSFEHTPELTSLPLRVHIVSEKESQVSSPMKHFSKDDLVSKHLSCNTNSNAAKAMLWNLSKDNFYPLNGKKLNCFDMMALYANNPIGSDSNPDGVINFK